MYYEKGSIYARGEGYLAYVVCQMSRVEYSSGSYSTLYLILIEYSFDTLDVWEVFYCM
jgi:hypothetical protein